MAEKKEWEIKSARDVAEALEWVRRRSKGRALVLVAIGVNSVAYAKDPAVSPADAARLVHSQLTVLRDGFEKIHAQTTTRGTNGRRE